MQSSCPRATLPVPCHTPQVKQRKQKLSPRDLPRCEVWSRTGSGALCAGGQLPTLLLGQVGMWGSAVQSRRLLFGIGGWICSMSSNTAHPCARQGPGAESSAG